VQFTRAMLVLRVIVVKRENMVIVVKRGKEAKREI
jgi:hypothetical protein